LARFHATVPSRRPTQDTFDYLATFGNAAEWDPGVLLRGPLRLLDALLGPGFRAVAERAAHGLAGALATDPARPRDVQR
jgi:hypothetical protein